MTFMGTDHESSFAKSLILFYFICSLGILFLKKSSKSDSEQFSMSKLYEKKISKHPVLGL